MPGRKWSLRVPSGSIKRAGAGERHWGDATSSSQSLQADGRSEDRLRDDQLAQVHAQQAWRSCQGDLFILRGGLEPSLKSSERDVFEVLQRIEVRVAQSLQRGQVVLVILSRARSLDGQQFYQFRQDDP